MERTPRDERPDFSRMLGRKIRLWRRFRGLAPAKLAEQADLPVDVLRRIEAGELAIELTALSRVLSVLGVGLGELIASPGPTSRGGNSIVQIWPIEAGSGSELADD